MAVQDKQQVQLRHPQGKKAIRMDQTKYELLRTEVITFMTNTQMCTHTELWHGVDASFKNNKIKFEGSVQWHVEWVKLDLEAHGIIVRLPGTSPIQFKMLNK